MSKKIRHKDSALIVIDVQNDYFEGGKLVVKEAELIIPIIKNLLVNCDFDLIIFSQNYHFENHISFNTFTSLEKKDEKDLDEKTLRNKGKFPPYCIIGTSGANIHKEIRCYAKVILQKESNLLISQSSVFENYMLNKILSDKGINTVYTCGLILEYSVINTAIEADLLGYNSFIIFDGTKPLSNDGISYIKKTLIKTKVKLLNSEDILQIDN